MLNCELNVVGILSSYQAYKNLFGNDTTDSNKKSTAKFLNTSFPEYTLYENQNYEGCYMKRILLSLSLLDNAKNKTWQLYMKAALM